MALFDRGKEKKAAEDAKKIAEAAARKAKAEAYLAKIEKSKALIAKTKAEKELKEVKEAKVRAEILARQRASGIKAGPVSGRYVQSKGHIHTAVPIPRIIASYTVKKGDTLGQIAKNFYGVTGPKYWNLIQAANKDLIKDVNKIDVGQVFKIPELPLELKKK